MVTDPGAYVDLFASHLLSPERLSTAASINAASIFLSEGKTVSSMHSVDTRDIEWKELFSLYPWRMD